MRASSVAAIFLHSALAAQQPQAGAAAFQQACLDATTDVAVLNVAAHPDDESDRTLVYLRRKLGFRTVTVYSTSGEGGQNAIGREIGPTLAAIRVRETLAAAAHTGVEVRWLGFPDFGYSKTAEETLRIWGKDELLMRMGVVLRDVRPDLVFTNHDLDNGHGHHRASAVAIRELVARLIDDGQRIRLYERVFERGGDGEPRSGQVKIDTAALDVARGLTFARQASDGRLEHRTQGPWRPHDPASVKPDDWNMVVASAGADPEPTRGLGSLLTEPAFVATWEAMGEDIGALQRGLDDFGRDRTQASHVAVARELLPKLRLAAQQLPSTAAGAAAARRLARRTDALQRVVLLGAGVDVEAWFVRQRLPLGGKARLRIAVHTSTADVRDVRATCRGHAGAALADGPDSVFEIELPVAYVDDREAARFTTYEPDWFDVDVAFTLDGLPLDVRQRLPAQIVPMLNVEWDREVVFVPSGDTVHERVLSLRVQYDGDDERTAPVELTLPDGVTGESIPPELELSPTHREVRALVRLRAKTAAGERASVRAKVDGASAEFALQPLAVASVAGLDVGLVRGPDDTLQRVLEDLGVRCTELDETRLAVTDLQQFSTVVIDIRAYFHRRDLADHRARLLQFCERGGRVVAFYHKPGEWNATERRSSLAPFALTIGDERVCEEDAKVEVLLPQHALLARPYAISAATFDGWVQERGLNFPSKWDEHWQPLLAMADSDAKPPLRGGLLYTDYGEGSYVYCSLALYRQLREGHVGVAQLLINLLTPAK